MKTIRIFISSPGDVAYERSLASEILKRVAKEFEGRLAVEPYFWEHEPYEVSRSFQHQIPAPGADSEARYDLMVCFLWSRLGSRLHGSLKLPDGSEAKSGTQFEVEWALHAKKLSGAPEVYLWLNRSEPVIPLEPVAEHDLRFGQYQALKEFITRLTTEEGAFVGAFNEYRHLGEFEELFETKLRKILERHADGISEEGTAAHRQPSWTDGSPFRGLQPFECEHAPVFFGRTAAIGDSLALLRRSLTGTTAIPPRGFQLILGSSGVGKSSLARAGLIPALTTPGVIEGAALWRTAIVKPSDARGHLFEGLAAALLAPDAFPELAGDGTDRASLSTRLAKQPAVVVEAILGALREAAKDLMRDQRAAAEQQAREFDASGRPDDARALREQIAALSAPKAMGVLLVDQLEELFTRSSDLRRRACFVETLRQLAESGRIVVLATMRADFYGRIAEEPVLADLAAGTGTFLLKPATPNELGQVIRLPAAAAGLVFEANADGKTLDEELRDIATRDPQILPLLEFALDRLYELREGHLLTWQSHRAMGGLEGALATHAEEALASLESDRQRECLNAVFGKLVALSVGDDEVPVRRVATIEELAASPSGDDELPGARAFVERFVERRLLVAGRDAHTGAVTYAIAHEALLRSWGKLEALIKNRAEYLRIRERCERRLRDWQEQNRDPSLLLPAGLAINELEKLLHEAPELAPPALSEYYAHSQTAIQRRKQRVNRIRNGVLAGLSVLTLFALIGGAIAAWQWREAERANQRNIENLRKASNADLASALKAWQEDFEAWQKGERAVGFNGKSRWHEAVALLVRALEHNPTNERAALWLYDTIRHQGTARRDWHSVEMRHENGVSNAVFSSCGARVVTASGATAHVWDALTGRPIGATLRHEGDVSIAAFSPDGSIVATASCDKTARIWNAETGLPIGKPLHHGCEVWGATFSPDGSRLITRDASGVAQVWDVSNGEPIGRPLRHEYNVASVAFSPDGSSVVTACCGSLRSGAGYARVWDVLTGQPITGHLKHEGVIFSAAFSPDGLLIVTASAIPSGEGMAHVWDVATGQLVGHPLRHENGVTSASFSPEGSRIITVSGYTARIWDVVTGRLIGQPLRHEYYRISSATFSSDGLRVVTASWDKTARVWDATSGQPLGELLRHEDEVNSAVFSPDGTQILTASSDGTARLWEVVAFTPIGFPLRHENLIHTAVFSPDGTRVITSGMGNTARIWDVGTGRLIDEHQWHEAGISSIGFSPDGLRVVTASWDKTARVWDATSGQPLGELLRHEDEVNSAVFSPDGTQILTASSDGTARLWDVVTGQSIGEPLRHKEGIETAAFSPDGTLVITASWDWTARVWDTSNCQPIGEPLLHADQVNSAAFSPDGTRVVTASWDKTARLWDAGKFRPMGELLWHADHVNSAAFSPDGTRVATASSDKTSRVWDAVTGRPIGEPLRHQCYVNSVAFSPDGSHVVTASDDDTARLWQVVCAAPVVNSDLLSWAAGVAGLHFREDGEWIEIPWSERMDVLSNTAGLPSDWRAWARPVPATGPNRVLSNAAHFTLRQIAERERDFKGMGTVESLTSALEYDYTLPLTRLLLANALEEDNAAKKPEDQDATIPARAAHLRRYDLDRLPGDAALWTRAAKALLDAPVGAMVGIGPPTVTAKAAALPTAEKAVALLDHDNPCPARMNLAHAYLFNDRFDEAWAIHERYLGTTFKDGRAWNDELRNDFKLLREAGHDHPDMKKIEALLE